MRKNLFFEKLNDQSGPWHVYVSRGLHTQAKAYVRRHILAYVARASKAYER